MGKEKSNPIKNFFTTILVIALVGGLLYLILKNLLWILGVIFGIYIIYKVVTHSSKLKPEPTYISYEEIRDNYYSLCKFYFKLDFEEKEDLEKIIHSF